jgi:Kef-type K+ transport system membrane component KefB
MLSPSLILILAVALAYLATHVAFDWLARRFMLVSGAEYLLLGILLGPQVSGVLSTETLAGLAPLLTLALGWIGAIVGTQFYLPGLIRIPALTYRLAFIEALATLAVVAGVETYVIAWLARESVDIAVVPAVALGAIAAVSAPAGIEVVARRLGGPRGPIVRQLQVATAIDALVGVVTLGILMCLQHPDEGTLARALTPTEWAVVTVAVGVVGGALFHLFLGGETDADRLFVSLGGAIILVSGAAAYLHLSPVLTAMIVGAMLTNTSRSRAEIAQTLARAERPFYFALLIFGGALWQPSATAWWAVPVIVFLIMRVFAKIGAARLGARVNGALPTVGGDWGKALLGQGGLAIALALDYSRFRGTVFANVVFTAAVVSVLLTDLTAAHLIHGVVSRLLPQARWHLPLRGARGDGAGAPAAEPTMPPPPDRDDEGTTAMMERR